MRILPAALKARLEAETATLARCWEVTRRDHVVLGFTDHDRDLELDHVIYRAGTGLEAAEASSELGFAVGGGDVSGALVSSGLLETDILNGLYDGAVVETRLVDWSAPEHHLLLSTAMIGEIRRRDGMFVAELRSPMSRFDEEQGRLYTSACNTDLGDARCGIDPDDPLYSVTGIVAESDGFLTLRALQVEAFATGWFDHGRLVWLSGGNQGLAGIVKSHSGQKLALWQRMNASIHPGDSFRVFAGCDKRFSTCRDRFSNSLNFRGFPHMPGNDFLVQGAAQGVGAFDGGSLFQ